MKRFTIGLTYAAIIVFSFRAFASDKAPKIHPEQQSNKLNNLFSEIFPLPEPVYKDVLIPLLGIEGLPKTLFPIELDPKAVLSHSHRHPISIGFNGEGTQATLTSINRRTEWDLQTKHPIATSHAVEEAASTVPAGTVPRLAPRILKNTVRFSIGDAQYTLEHPAPVINAHLDPSEKMLVTACKDGVARVWSAHNGKLLYSRSKEHLRLAKGMSQDTIVLAARNQAACIAIPSGVVLFRVSDDHSITHLAIDSTGNKMLTATKDSVTLWDKGEFPTLTSGNYTQKQQNFLLLIDYHMRANEGLVSLETIAKKEQIPLADLQTTLASFTPKEQAWLHKKYLKKPLWTCLKQLIGYC